MIAQLSWIGEQVALSVEGFGQFTRFCFSANAWFWRGIIVPKRWRLLFPQLYQVGTRSIPVVMVVGAFVGMVLAVEAYDQFAAIGQEVRLGGIINISVVKQIGPVLAAVMIAGRVGGSVSAELGTMHVTEQLDALRVMGTDPIAYLVVPRIVGCVIMVPILTVFSDLMGMLGGYLITVRGFGVNDTLYWEFSQRYVESWDVASGLIKSVIFGFIIGLISCYKGFHCRPGARGVGQAATESFVAAFLTIIVVNFFMAKFLNDLYIVVFGHSGVSAFRG